MTRAAPLLALALLGCGTRNALLELEIDLTVADDVGAVELLVLSDPGDGAPDWDAAVVEALPERGDRAAIDLLAEDPAIEAPLALGLRLCPTACGAGPPDVAWRLERAFYLGRVTHLSLAVPDPLPDDVVAIDRCAMPGCIEDVEDYCRLDGTHYCEDE